MADPTTTAAPHCETCACDRVPVCPRCDKKVGGWPLPPGSYVLGCGATVTVDDAGKAVAFGWNE